MSVSFNCLLVGPTPSQILDALAQAGKHRRGRAESAEHWQPVLVEIQENRDGRTQLEHISSDQSGDGYLIVVWWTDHRGVRHIRICSGDTADLTDRLHFSRFDQDLRPPVWHIDPEHVYCVSRPKLSVTWRASCVCGATGLPEEILWMGSCCGPCHDRREEGDPHVTPAHWKLRSSGHRIMDVVFHPRNESVILSRSDGQVEAVSLLTQEAVPLITPDEGSGVTATMPLVMSPSGRFLAAGHFSSLRILLWDFEKDTVRTLDAPRSHGMAQPITRMVFSPQEAELAVWRSARSLEVWRLEETRWNLAYERPMNLTAMAYAPDGKTLAVASPGGRIRFLDPATGTQRDQIQTPVYEGEEILYLEYLPHGRALVQILGLSQGGHQQQQLRLLDLGSRKIIHEAHIPAPAAVALTPRGDYLTGFVYNERLPPSTVYFWSVATWELIGWVEWNPEEQLTALAFSSDDQTLVTGSAEGHVKLYPWRLLLEG